MKKGLKIAGIVIGVIVILFIAIFTYTSLTSKKLVCKSDEGNITIMYSDKKIKGYTAKNIKYDLDGQQELAEIIGVEEYLDQFETWFETNTTGSCKR